MGRVGSVGGVGSIGSVGRVGNVGGVVSGGGWWLVIGTGCVMSNPQ